MNRSSADELLTGTALVACIEGSIAYAKELERSLLEADVPALLAKPPVKACCGLGGCGCQSKVQVMVREADLPRVTELFRNEWIQAVVREGTPAALHPGPLKHPGAGLLEPEGDLPCPACGTAAPLVEGACSDCGLQLDT